MSNDPRISPLAATSLTGVAPAVVHTAHLDLLRDEGNQLAEDLRASGVRVIAREFPTLNHGYFGLGGVSPAADAAGTQAAEDLREHSRAAGTAVDLMPGSIGHNGRR